MEGAKVGSQEPRGLPALHTDMQGVSQQGDGQAARWVVQGPGWGLLTHVG